jgi:hypothetical protein
MGPMTVSAKISEKTAREILDLGYTISDVIQVSIQLFLNLTGQEKLVLIEQHLRQKKQERAVEKYRKIGKF